MRYFLDCDSSGFNREESITMFLNRFTHVVCVDCSIKWKCSTCNIQYVPELYMMYKCGNCECIICQECIWFHNEQEFCDNCISSSMKNTVMLSKSSNQKWYKWGRFEF